jgi:uncharacterized membrane protein
MNDKERFDGLMRLAELRTHRATNRQIYEWRVTFGLWALIAAAILYLKDKQIPLWLGVAILFIYAFFWLRPIYVAHRRDNQTAAFYMQTAIAVLRPNGEVASQDKLKNVTWFEWWLGFLSEWGCSFQLLTNVLVSFL